MNAEEEIQLLEGLIDQLLAGIQEILQSGERLSDEFQGMIAQELELTTNRIDELRRANPIDQLSTASLEKKPELQNPGMQSSNINSFGYDDKNGNLLVKFQGDYPQQNGPVYSYEGVPKVIFDLFRQGAIPARTDGSNRWGRWFRGKVPSLGASLFTLIRNGGYGYTRLS